MVTFLSPVPLVILRLQHRALSVRRSIKYLLQLRWDIFMDRQLFVIGFHLLLLSLQHLNSTLMPRNFQLIYAVTVHLNMMPFRRFLLPL